MQAFCLFCFAPFVLFPWLYFIPALPLHVECGAGGGQCIVHLVVYRCLVREASPVDLESLSVELRSVTGWTFESVFRELRVCSNV